MGNWAAHFRRTVQCPECGKKLGTIKRNGRSEVQLSEIAENLLREHAKRTTCQLKVLI